MIGDLPELDSFFNHNSKAPKKSETNGHHESYDDIYIFFSKDSENWIASEFIDIAVAGIGIHIRLPVTIDLTAEEINRAKIKFVKITQGFEEILKEAPVLVRWQDHDELSGFLKLGLHFHGELKDDLVLQDIMKRLRKTLNKNG